MFSDLIYQECLMSNTHYMTRKEHISAVVIHYTATVVRDAADVVSYWEQSNLYTSANYIIDVQGRITGVVPEEYRPYTSGSWGAGKRDIDDRAITIECSTDNDQDGHISGLTIDALCKLLADIGKRYGIWWRFTGDESGNVHAHRWYQNTPCPGDYLYSKFDLICDIANYIIYKQEEVDVDEIDERLADLEGHTLPMYEKISDVPDWGKEEITWLVDHGYLKGDENGLNLSYDMLRSMVILARALMEK